MRDPERIADVLAAIEIYWRRHPDLRLGQLVVHVAKEATGHTDPFYVEDETIVSVLRVAESKSQGDKE